MHNGEIGDIVSVNAEEKTATVRVLGDDPREITLQGLTGNPEIDDEAMKLDMLYGHAMTVHKSQGATIKQLKNAGESIGRGGNGYALFADNAMTNSNLAYVAGSRNEGQFHLFCSKVDEEAVMKKAAKAQVLDSLLNYKVDEKTLEAAKDFDLAQAAKEEMSREAEKLLKADQKKAADKAPPLDTVAHVEGAGVEPGAGMTATAAPAAIVPSPELAEKIGMLEADLDHMCGEDLFELEQEHRGYSSMCSDLAAQVQGLEARLGLPKSPAPELPAMPDLGRLAKPDLAHTPEERALVLESTIARTTAGIDETRAQIRGLAARSEALAAQISDLEKRLFAQRKMPEWAEEKDMFQEKSSHKEPWFMREMEHEKTFGERLRDVGKMPYNEQARALDKLQADTAMQSMQRQAQERAAQQAAQVPEHSQSVGTGQRISRGRR